MSYVSCPICDLHPIPQVGESGGRPRSTCDSPACERRWAAIRGGNRRRATAAVDELRRLAGLAHRAGQLDLCAHLRRAAGELEGLSSEPQQEQLAQAQREARRGELESAEAARGGRDSRWG